MWPFLNDVQKQQIRVLADTYKPYTLVLSERFKQSVYLEFLEAEIEQDHLMHWMALLHKSNSSNYTLMEFPRLIQIYEKITSAISLSSASDAKLKCLSQYIDLISIEMHNPKDQEYLIQKTKPHLDKIIDLLNNLGQVNNHSSNEYANALKNVILLHGQNEKVQPFLPIALRLMEKSYIDANIRVRLAQTFLLHGIHVETSCDFLSAILSTDGVSTKNKHRMADFLLDTGKGTTELKLWAQKLLSEVLAEDQNKSFSMHVETAENMLKGPDTELKKRAWEFLYTCIEWRQKGFHRLRKSLDRTLWVDIYLKLLEAETEKVISQ